MKLHHYPSASLICGLLSLAAIAATGQPKPQADFAADWRFLRADVAGAEAPEFADGGWRLVEVPHDWSIEDLPATNGAPPSPFNPQLSAGGAATGFVVGGTGWYRKHFTLRPEEAGKHVTILFDGVYMNADFWINGRPLGNHPYGYTAFSFDLTPHLKPAGRRMSSPSRSRTRAGTAGGTAVRASTARCPSS